MTLFGDSWADFWRRVRAMIVKEFLQLRRDRITLATMVTVPLMQLVLFGYAINTSPRDLPAAVLMQEQSDVSRSILAALQNTKYFKITEVARDEAEFDHLLASGRVLFGIEIPAGFERAVRRGDRPALLVAADATDPVADAGLLASSAVQNFAQSYGWLIMYSGWFTGESDVAETFPTRNEFGRRAVDPTNGSHNADVWFPLSQAMASGYLVLDLTLPKNRLIVFTGVSGSGTSSLAFDTLYEEGQRRFVE